MVAVKSREGTGPWLLFTVGAGAAVRMVKGLAGVDEGVSADADSADDEDGTPEEDADADPDADAEAVRLALVEDADGEPVLAGTVPSPEAETLAVSVADALAVDETEGAGELPASVDPVGSTPEVLNGTMKTVTVSRTVTVFKPSAPIAVWIAIGSDNSVVDDAEADEEGDAEAVEEAPVELAVDEADEAGTVKTCRFCTGTERLMMVAGGCVADEMMVEVAETEVEVETAGSSSYSSSSSSSSGMHSSSSSSSPSSSLSGSASVPVGALEPSPAIPPSTPDAWNLSSASWIVSQDRDVPLLLMRGRAIHVVEAPQGVRAHFPCPDAVVTCQTSFYTRRNDTHPQEHTVHTGP